MRQIKETVTKCIDGCPYYREDYFCGKEQRHIEMDVDGNYFPSWCPLPILIQPLTKEVRHEVP
jgi:hypothetical protein